MSDPDIPATKKKVDDLKAKIQDFKNNMNGFSKAMRCLYLNNNSGAPNDAIKRYMALRDQTRNDGEVYLNAILPLSKKFVVNVEMYFQNFALLTYDQWVQCLQDMMDEAKEYQAEAEVVIQIHKQLIVVLKERENEAEIIVQQLGDLEKKFKERAEELEKDDKARHTWAYGLCACPFIALFVAPFLAKSGDGEAEKAKLLLKEAQMTEAGSLMVSKSLLPALEKFIEGMVAAAGFFEVLITDLGMFISKGTNVDPKRKLYFFLMHGEATNMKDDCEMFYAALPDIETDFKAIPKPPNQDYINNWIANEKRLIRTALSPKLADDLIKLIVQ